MPEEFGYRRKRRKRNKGLDLNIISMEPHILRPPVVCQYCGAKRFEYESEGFCCSNGKIILKSHDVPVELYELYTSALNEATEFRSNVRIYNSSFAFTSLGVKYDKDLCAMSKGIYTFRVQGQMHHFINPVTPVKNPPTYLQLYFHDTEHELENRLTFSDRMNLNTLAKIKDILRVNPYCQFFRTIGSVPNLEDHKIKINCDPGLDQRIYNAPSVSQVAAMWVTDGSDAGSEIRDIVVHCHDGKSHIINYYFGCYDPLSYPLLFPFGEAGWHQGIQKSIGHSGSSLRSETIVDLQEIASPCELITAEISGSSSFTCQIFIFYFCFHFFYYVYFINSFSFFGF